MRTPLKCNLSTLGYFLVAPAEIILWSSPVSIEVICHCYLLRLCRVEVLPFIPFIRHSKSSCHACWQIKLIPKPYKHSRAVRCSNLTVHPSHLLQKAGLQNLVWVWVDCMMSTKHSRVSLLTRWSFRIMRGQARLSYLYKVWRAHLQKAIWPSQDKVFLVHCTMMRGNISWQFPLVNGPLKLKHFFLFGSKLPYHKWRTDVCWRYLSLFIPFNILLLSNSVNKFVCDTCLVILSSSCQAVCMELFPPWKVLVFLQVLLSGPLLWLYWRVGDFLGIYWGKKMTTEWQAV